MLLAEIDLALVADLLRTRRRALQPEDVGLPRGPRRRTAGLRREEVAAMASMSTAYYTRLERYRCERHRGPHPSPRMLAGIARSLRFTRAERDQLFRAAGYDGDEYQRGTTHVEPGLMHVLDRLTDTPALIIDAVGEVLHQTHAARALFGDTTQYPGWARSSYFRWFTRPAERCSFATDEHSTIGSEIAVDLRRTLETAEETRLTLDLVQLLLERSDEFAGLWGHGPSSTTVSVARSSRVVHRELGTIDLEREMLCSSDFRQRLVIYYAAPGLENRIKLQLASVIGQQRLRS